MSNCNVIFQLYLNLKLSSRLAAITETTSTVVLGAHYDSRGVAFETIRAPGANDDGSGTISLLAIARAISRQRVKFHGNLEIIAFSGEEQGEVGSKAYARQYLSYFLMLQSMINFYLGEQRDANANITMMIQADMLGYHVAGEPFQIGFPDWSALTMFSIFFSHLHPSIHTPEVTHLVGNISNLYVPEIHVGRNPVSLFSHMMSLNCSRVCQYCGGSDHKVYCIWTLQSCLST